MAWISGRYERVFEVNRSLDEVSEYFLDPDRFRAAFNQLQSFENLGDQKWRWILLPKTELGVTFQGDYTVQYERDGLAASWSTLEGNMRTSGRVACREVDTARTEVTYSETLEVELPVPKFSVRLFQPIVAREVKHGVGDFLDTSVRLLEHS